MKPQKIFYLIIILYVAFQINYLPQVQAQEINYTPKYNIYINNQELTTYDLINDPNIKITQEYNQEDPNLTLSAPQELNLNYSYRLYNNYTYKLSLYNNQEVIETKTININYIGDNNNIININNLYYKNKTYYILGKINEYLTVLDILQMFRSNLELYNAQLTIIDPQEEELSLTDIVQTNYKIKLYANYIEYGNINEVTDYFNINIVTDINKDGAVDYNDINSLITNEILNNNPIFKISDLITPQTKEPCSNDIITSHIETSNYSYPNNIIEVKYYLDSLNNNYLKAIKGTINYNQEILELITITSNNQTAAIINNKFLNIYKNYNNNSLLLILKFKALKPGVSYITINNIEISTNNTNTTLDNNSKETKIEILPQLSQEVLQPSEKNNNPITYLSNTLKQDLIPDDSPQEEIYEELIPAKSIQFISLSTDNDIKSLTIKEYNINFNKDTLEYFIKVGNDVDNLNIDIILNDNNSYYEITGNENFKNGSNKVDIIITSLAGNTKTYTINVLKEKENIKEEKNNSRTIITIFIAFITINLFYLILKK